MLPRKGAKILIGGTMSVLYLSFTCSPARADRETAFALALPESLPALPPALNKIYKNG